MYCSENVSCVTIFNKLIIIIGLHTLIIQFKITFFILVESTVNYSVKHNILAFNINEFFFFFFR